MAYSVCPHHVSHYLGIDVHDTGTVKRSIPLEPGMVITIEPGKLNLSLYRRYDYKLLTRFFQGCTWILIVL